MSGSQALGHVGTLADVRLWVAERVEEASRLAARRRQAVWTSARAEALGPLADARWSVASPQLAWGFREPSGRLTLGWGEALAARTEGSRALSAAAAALAAAGRAAELPQDLWVGGGAAFEAGRSWRGFPDASLVLPELTLRREPDGRGWWQLAARVSPQDSPAAVAARLAALVPMAPLPPRGACLLATRFVPRPERWRSHVASVVRALDRGRVGKVVLARAVDLVFAEPLALDDLWASLAQDSAACAFVIRHAGGVFLGASPETLVRVVGRRVYTQAVAGTERRAGEGSQLAARGKDRREHRVVVDTIVRRLAPLVDDVAVHPMAVRAAGPLNHLVTPIEGTLRPECGLDDVVAALHPTPAVGGEPPEAARAWQQRLEATPRGWYAGPVGLAPLGGAAMPEQAGGAYYVGLRSAWIRGRRARLYAGCGLVRGSDPDRELEESSDKLGVMVRALGGMALAPSEGAR